MTTTMTLPDLRRFLEPWDRFGFEEEHDALTWESPTETTNRAWLHQVMLPHAPDELDRFYGENRFLGAFRHPLIWREMNGFNLFSRVISLFGPALPSKPPRVWRAIDVVSTNAGQTDLHKRFDGIIFGAAGRGLGKNVWLMESRSGEVMAVDREGLEETFRWPDFDTFLSAVLNDLAVNWSEEERRVTCLSFLAGGV